MVLGKKGLMIIRGFCFLSIDENRFFLDKVLIDRFNGGKRKMGFWRERLEFSISRGSFRMFYEISSP